MPYLEELDGRSILELPVHWSLDDWPYFAWSIDDGGEPADPARWRSVWLGELESALRERRHVTYTMHPEVIGRGYRVAALRELVEAMQGRGRVWFATHGEVAEAVREVGP